ncbi:MAG: MFS transporter [Rhodospirillaceae bacterium]|jgi:MFS family permease|nr:MFS transporter [Rhodospirillaceae bacterium]MBT5455285.1 MFS transporter [Rhodospirillaceae bacterium]
MADTAQPDRAADEKPQSFAAMRHPGARAYLIGGALAMMADSIEHVISYWMIYEKFHSPMLGGFAILSHWLPFLLFSFWAGSLADRFDPRRVIQWGMVLFMLVSLGWGVLFLTDSLQMWHAAVLLTIHGLAGVLWAPAGQLLVHDIVGGKQLQSAIRTQATTRTLGLLLGPAIGGGLMVWLGPTYGIFINVLIYLPLTIWLWKAPYGPAFRKEERPAANKLGGFADILATFAAIKGTPVIITMIAIAGVSSFVVGNAYQGQMPAFAEALGYGDAGLFYSLLFTANAAGAITAGIVLETGGFQSARPKPVFIMVLLWCAAMAGFAATKSYPLAFLLLFMAGFLNLSFSSMSRALVQLNSPPAIRGRVIGLYNMSDLGLRSFSGMTVGFGGSLIGIHWSLGLSAAVLFVVVVAMMIAMLRRIPPETASDG